MANQTIKLDNLIGKHQLSAIEMYEEQVKSLCWEDTYEDSNVIKFTLDGVTYKATEDLDDGYRSYCRALEIVTEQPRIKFAPQEVICRRKALEEQEEWDEEWDEPYEEWLEEQKTKSKVFEFVDVVTEKVVFEIGTDYSCSYYPMCIIKWNPQNLACNIGR